MTDNHIEGTRLDKLLHSFDIISLNISVGVIQCRIHGDPIFSRGISQDRNKFVYCALDKWTLNRLKTEKLNSQTFNPG